MRNDNDAPELDQPDADAVSAHYLETCRRLGVEPTPRERVRQLIAEWSATLESTGVTKH